MILVALGVSGDGSRRDRSYTSVFNTQLHFAEVIPITRMGEWGEACAASLHALLLSEG